MTVVLISSSAMVLTYLLLYVNDMLITARNKTHIQKLKTQLKEEFNMKDLREVKKILGRSTDRLWLSQENYVLKMLERFNMAEARPVTSPLTSHFRLSSSQYSNSQEKDDRIF